MTISREADSLWAAAMNIKKWLKDDRDGEPHFSIGELADKVSQMLSSVDNEQQELSFADIVADSDGWSQAAYEIYRGKSDAEIRSILVVAKKVLELLQGHRPVEEADLKTFNAFLDHVILYRNAHVSFHGCGHRHQVMGQE